MKAKSIQGKSIAVIQNKLERLLSDDFKPTLAFVFISLREKRKSTAGLLLDSIKEK